MDCGARGARVVVVGCVALAACAGPPPDVADRSEPKAEQRTALVDPGSVGAARAWHSATLLADGTVLIAGGQQDGRAVPLANADLYVSAERGFEPLPPLRNARYRHTATRLQDGTVLVAGGFGESGAALASAELFLPDSRTFTAVGEMSAARGAHTATLLRDGRVLILGGSASASSTAGITAVEVYNPASRTFSVLAATPSYAAAHNVAVTLVDGKVAVLWSASGKVETFDPLTNQFSGPPPELASLPDDLGQIVSATRLSDDSLAVFGTQRVFNTGVAGTCKLDEQICDGQCTNLRNDPENCGGCGVNCRHDLHCVDGRCSSDCELKRDLENCGDCGITCPQGAVCDIWGCAPSCQYGFVLCDGTCVDLLRDSENCGSCGKVCPSGCTAGHCAFECPSGEASCLDGGVLVCTKLYSDPHNCGSCGTWCDYGQECAHGRCVNAELSSALDADRSAVVTRGTDSAWVTYDSIAIEFRERDAAAWTTGPPSDLRSESSPFGGIGHTATALPDGSILTVGGSSSPSVTRLTLPWHVRPFRLAPPFGQASSEHVTSALLPNGHVLFAVFESSFFLRLVDFDGDPSNLVDLGHFYDTVPVALVPQPTGNVLMIARAQTGDV